MGSHPLDEGRLDRAVQLRHDGAHRKADPSEAVLSLAVVLEGLAGEHQRRASHHGDIELGLEQADASRALVPAAVSPRDHQVGLELSHELGRAVAEDCRHVHAAGLEGLEEGAGPGVHAEPPAIGEVQEHRWRSVAVAPGLARPADEVVSGDHQVRGFGMVVAVLRGGFGIPVGLAAAEVVAREEAEQIGDVAGPAVLPVLARLLGIARFRVRDPEPVVAIGR